MAKQRQGRIPSSTNRFDKGANTEVKGDIDGGTPLMWAASQATER